ncbi:MAG: hypothetical protein HXX15_19780 [Rhodopseudomonas sp.]|uniref:hypothetical protein n=1 Tax=Rhodopseudomonas sp. TaxID=1078 RepID=UPI0017E40909|nr:hypothetical protein [Rhodopseudomonas sp.]NVN88327.1 hypothetical protein [Rhodopseudomonas sp.]
MASYPSQIWRVIGAASFAAVLCVVQAAANASMAATTESVGADAIVPVAAATNVAGEKSRSASSLPASGAEGSVSRAMASSASPVAKQHRIATSRPYRRTAASSDDRECSGSWCGRHFVLMLGVGY